jgi:hypothetical protein
VALTLGPYDYWIAGRRARAAAGLWNVLPPDDQSAAERQARLLWDVPLLRPEIPALLRTADGAHLLAQAMGNDPQNVREINRWLSDELRTWQRAAQP